MNELRSLFARVQVLVIGDLMVDEYLFGTVQRISPEAPVPVVDVRSRLYVPGGAANVAANVHGLGAEVRLLGVCGRDAAAESLRAGLARLGIPDNYIVSHDGRATTCKTRVIGGHQQIVRFDSEHRAALSPEESGLLFNKLGAALQQADLCILSDYGKGVLTADLCQSVIESARERRLPVLVDPKGIEYAKYRGCTLLTPNLREAAEASGTPIETEADLNRAGARLLQLLDGSSILITRGPDGMTLFRPQKPPLTIPTVAREVFDVVGAGDTAVATLGVSIAAGLSIETGTRLANIAAGIAVGKQGTAAVSIEELLRHEETRTLDPAILEGGL
jgi:D-beta-D-heptose 7-phosphate kinase/D-beta-D-heptose 1-phosphate adenosyltransferase